MIKKNMLIKTDKEYNFDISLISDIHADKNTDYSILDRYINELYKYNIQYIAFLGDSLNDGIDLESAKKISDYFYKMGKYAPVFMVLGNHDLVTKKGDRWFLISKDEDKEKLNEIINLYKSIPNVNYLDNKSVNINDINIYGLNPTGEYYLDDTPKDKQMELLYPENKELFDNSSYNIILCHSPKDVFNKVNEQKIFNNVDLILSGHMHNGLLPVYLEHFVPGTKGLVGKRNGGPYLFPELSKGRVELGDRMTGIIANPVCTFSSDKGKYTKLNSLYPVPFQTVKVRKLIK